MTTWHRANLRIDVHTAAVIDHGVAIQGIAGPSMAYQYFIQRSIPLAIIKRVMASPRERRQPGAVGLPPLSR